MGIEITDGGQRVLDVAQARAEGNAPDDELFTPDLGYHDPAEGLPPGGAGLAWYWDGFAKSFSDVRRERLETIATPEHLTTVTTLSGTHTGDYQGHPPTGRRFSVRTVQVFRYEDGRMAERWGASDVQGILQQLGLA